MNSKKDEEEVEEKLKSKLKKNNKNIQSAEINYQKDKQPNRRAF